MKFFLSTRERNENILWTVQFASNDIAKILNSLDPNKIHGQDINIIWKYHNIESCIENGLVSPFG